MKILMAALLLAQASDEKRLLYVASPGIRNYVEWGGKGVLVYDIDEGHRLLRRIASPFDDPEGKVENIKGVCASAATGRLWVSTLRRLACLDLATEKWLWVKAYEGGCDRMSVSPDGKILYVPSLEKDHWHAVDASSGDVLAKLMPRNGAHNTVYGADGRAVYLGGLKAPILYVADPAKHEIAREIGPFSGAVRPFTVNRAQTRAYVCVNGLSGFEVADLTSGRMIHRVEVPSPVRGQIKRHGCPSHGVGLTPDETQVWVVEAAAQAVHVYDNTVEPPRFVATIPLEVDQPGWVTFTIRGDLAYPSTGEIFDVKSRAKVGQLRDEEGRPVQSEKMLEIDVVGGRVVRAGDQFGVGRK